MDSVLINNKININIPDSYLEFTKEELKNSFSTDFAVKAFKDTNENVISIMWQHLNRVLSVFLDLKSMTRQNQIKTSKLYLNYNYELKGFIEKNINGIKMSGYKYTYVLNNDKREVLCLLFKNKGDIYSFNFYKLANNDLEFKEFEDIINSIKNK